MVLCIEWLLRLLVAPQTEAVLVWCCCGDRLGHMRCGISLDECGEKLRGTAVVSLGLLCYTVHCLTAAYWCVLATEKLRHLLAALLHVQCVQGFAALTLQCVKQLQVVLAEGLLVSLIRKCSM